MLPTPPISKYIRIFMRALHWVLYLSKYGEFSPRKVNRWDNIEDEGAPPCGSGLTCRLLTPSWASYFSLILSPLKTQIKRPPEQ